MPVDLSAIGVEVHIFAIPNARHASDHRAMVGDHAHGDGPFPQTTHSPIWQVSLPGLMAFSML
jgi:hypothetical protein